VRLSDDDRSDLATIRSLPVGIGVNSTTPLSNLATAKFSETFGSINREDSNRRSAVLVNLRGRDTEGFVNEARTKVEQEVQLPQGYYLQWGGNFKNLQEARNRLLILTPLALVLVLLMIYAAFRSVGQTLLIFSCVPLALVGGVIGLIANGLPFSISAGVGFIALSGIAALEWCDKNGYKFEFVSESWFFENRERWLQASKQQPQGELIERRLKQFLND
jgi:cobalt-zinc-cadmium resistance protein CzcA